MTNAVGALSAINGIAGAYAYNDSATSGRKAPEMGALGACQGAALADLRSALQGKLSSGLDAQVLVPHPAGNAQKGAL